jgi:signal transduction histidine kinase/ligand-binding sensor domain-containing protein
MRLLVVTSATVLMCAATLVQAGSYSHQSPKGKFTSENIHASDSVRGQKTPRLNFQHFNVEDGLSQGSIRAILQDHNGFMWIGTYDGLNRFDGVEFKVYRHRPDDSTSLSDNRITCIYEDREHDLWVGTEGGGLCRFDRTTDSFRRIRFVTESSESTTEYYVFSVYESNTVGPPTLWVGSSTLCVFDREQQVLRPVVAKGAGSFKEIYEPAKAFAEDYNGFLWLGGNWVCRFDPHTRTVDHILSIPSMVTSMVIPRDNPEHILWIGSLKDLMKIDQKTGSILQRWPMFVTTLCEDYRGRLWIGGDKGLLRMTKESGNEELITVAAYTPGSESGLNNNNILTMYEDASGALWIGTFNGLNRLDEHAPAFSLYRHHPENPNSLASDFIIPIMEDGESNIWFGTFGGGVSILHQKGERDETFSHMRHDPAMGTGLCGDNIRSLLQDRTGTMWIGTDNGLNAYDTRTKSIKSYATTPFRHMRFWTEAMCEAKDGTIWAVPEEGGLIKIEHVGNVPISNVKNKNGRLISTSNGIQFTSFEEAKSSDAANVLTEDRHGTLWIGTENGLIGFDPRNEKTIRYVHAEDDPASLSNNSVWSIYEDPNDSADVLWVGTSEGLNKFDISTGKCIHYLEQAGFPNSFVYGILRDNLGRLWLSTNHGLTCFDDRQPDGVKFKNYDVSDGLQGNEFNRRSFCQLRNGELLFGGTHGVTRFNPLHIQINPYVPPVALTSFTKFGKQVEFGRNITDVSSIDLKYDETVFAFEFAALNYTNAPKNQYAYMMEGFDNGWIHSGGRRYASYTHLDPGEYVFRVKASNNDGVWNEKGIAVLIRIHPPFWQTWWFISLACIAVAGSLLAVYQRRVKGLEKEKRAQQEFSLRLMESQENERKRIAGELHDSLGQDLLVVRNRALLGLKDTALSTHARDQLDQISSVATQAINNVREISYDLRPYQLDRLGLTKAIASLASVVADSSPMRLSMEVDAIDNEIGKDQSIHVYRIVQEGINNILKHSDASEASVIIRKEGNNIRIIINDNGNGIPSESANDVHGKHRFGLIGITERAKAMSGTVTIQSISGQGTTLTVIIPRNKISI